MLSTPSPCAGPRDQGLGGAQVSGGSWRLRPRESLLAEFSVRENSPVLTICTRIHLVWLCFFLHLRFPTSRLFFQTFSVFSFFFFCCETPCLLEQRVSVRFICYIPKVRLTQRLKQRPSATSSPLSPFHPKVLPLFTHGEFSPPGTLFSFASFPSLVCCSCPHAQTCPLCLQSQSASLPISGQPLTIPRLLFSLLPCLPALEKGQTKSGVQEAQGEAAHGTNTTRLPSMLSTLSSTWPPGILLPFFSSHTYTSLQAFSSSPCIFPPTPHSLGPGGS